MLDREVSAGASHAGHDFISDQKHAMAAADFGDGLQISRRRNDGAQRRAAYWFEDERGGLSVAGFDGTIEFRGILLAAVAASVGAIEVAAVAVGHADVRELAHHRQIHLPAALVARHRQRSERRAVITLLAAENLVALGCPIST